MPINKKASFVTRSSGTKKSPVLSNKSTIIPIKSMFKIVPIPGYILISKDKRIIISPVNCVACPNEIGDILEMPW